MIIFENEVGHVYINLVHVIWKRPIENGTKRHSDLQRPCPPAPPPPPPPTPDKNSYQKLKLKKSCTGSLRFFFFFFFFLASLPLLK